MYSLFLSSLCFVTFLGKSESFLIPFLIYDAAKHGWFQETFGGGETPSTTPSYVPAPTVDPVFIRTTTSRRTTTTTRTTTTEAPQSVEYVDIYNPCGFGPLSAFNPRDSIDGSLYIPNVPEDKRYKYTIKDIGKNTSDIDSYLLHSLQNMKNPNFYSHSAFFKYGKPMYDHYKIHRYNFNTAKVPTKITVDSAKIMDCTEDSMKLCPPPTMSLCMSNGAIFCVANRTSYCHYPVSSQYCINIAVDNKTFTKKFREQMPCFTDVLIDGDYSFAKTEVGTTVLYKNKFLDEIDRYWDNIKYNSDLSHRPRRLGEREESPFQDIMDKYNKQMKEIEDFDIMAVTKGHKPKYEANLFCSTLIALPGKSRTPF